MVKGYDPTLSDPAVLLLNRFFTFQLLSCLFYFFLYPPFAQNSLMDHSENLIS